ncbi:hypothetical protein E1298_01225 [Actinomadura rubrisoli]|uniref:Uncharacterized protein n=1 Tax=Actinomadura rubrisoli TaxID=2530368 RepID=A0A4R5CFE4_9ACTN|nr:hypothetical protein E1298_01225 [Actinomadura rubrisoli]
MSGCEVGRRGGRGFCWVWRVTAHRPQRVRCRGASRGSCSGCGAGSGRRRGRGRCRRGSRRDRRSTGSAAGRRRCRCTGPGARRGRDGRGGR